MNQTSKIILFLIITAIIACSGFYYWQNQNPEVSQQIIKNSLSISAEDTTKSETKEGDSKITVIVPENYDSYKKNMTEFVQMGGQDPLPTTKFIEKELTIPHTSDPIKASAQAAAEEMKTGGGPTQASIEYLKIQNGTAYVLLNIDLDGWAGVSVSLAIIHPLVEKTLLQFPEINKVVFDYAPKDK